MLKAIEVLVLILPLTTKGSSELLSEEIGKCYVGAVISLGAKHGRDVIDAKVCITT